MVKSNERSIDFNCIHPQRKKNYCWFQSFRLYEIFEMVNSTTCWQVICKGDRMMNLVIETISLLLKYSTNNINRSQMFQQTHRVQTWSKLKEQENTSKKAKQENHKNSNTITISQIRKWWSDQNTGFSWWLFRRAHGDPHYIWGWKHRWQI